MKKFISMLLSITLIFSLLPVSHTFADDVTGIALEKEMRAMIEKGIIAGYENGKYAPGEQVSRGQFATFIARALNLPEGDHVFTDVSPKSSLASGINAAYAAGIVTGISTTKFAPDSNITRVEMAAMIDRALDYLGVTKTKGTLNFIDEQEIGSSSFRLAVMNMVGLKIINGYPVDNGYAFKPRNEATRAEAAAFISRMLDVFEAQEGEIPTYDYSIGTVDANGNVKTSSRTYQTYAEAVKAYSSAAASAKVILYKDEIISMDEGIVVATPRTGSATTIIYQSDMKTYHGPVASGTELEYVSSDDSVVTVKVAGVTGYVYQEDVQLIHTLQKEGQSYYSVDSSGDLLHYLYNHTTGKYSSYVYGKAPSTFKQNVKYYSWDGATFTNESGLTVGTYYQYFNMLPVRTSTNYSASELEAIIQQRLAEREALYTKNPTTYARYKDATTKSKLIGLGKILKDFEKYHKMNALLVLSMAIHESDYGMSANAQNKNNIFGIKVYDSNTAAGETYATIRDCVASLSNNYINLNYVPVSGAYANGGMVGNKGRGMNVRYASDPYWGQKIAGHMYKLDKEMGGKDFVNNASPYAIYETTSENLNVRSTAAVTSSNLLYTYKKAGYAVAVVGTTSDKAFHKILSDSKDEQYGYISTQYATKLTIAK
ncbi:MAG: S-layer homology domain-containing protein [Bacillus sp. (in: firmicutes)]